MKGRHSAAQCRGKPTPTHRIPVARLSMDELEEGRRIAALVVKHCGKKYLPLFSRLDEEIMQRVDQQDRLSLCLKSQAPMTRVRRRSR